MSPFSVLNDGQLELVASCCKSRCELLSILDGAQKNGGTHCYNEKINSFFRGKAIKLIIKSENEYRQGFSVDGEDYRMRKFVKVVCMPGEIQMLTDFSRLYSEVYVN